MDLKSIDIFVGEKLTDRRRIVGLKQRDLAQQLGISRQQIQKYERGENRIGASVLYRMAHILDVDVEYFFTGYDSIKSKFPRTQPKKSVKYDKLDMGTIEDLVSSFSRLPTAAQKNMLTLIKNLTPAKKKANGRS